VSIIFFDVDGTIMGRDGYIPASAGQAIRQLRKNGHYCLLNTGRPFIDLEPELINIGFDGFVCTCGQHVLFQNKLLFHDGFDPKTSQLLYDLGLRCHMDMYFESEQGVWVEQSHPLTPELQMSLDRFARRGIVVDSPSNCRCFQFDKFSISYTEGSLLPEFLNQVQTYCEVIRREGTMYELPKRGNSKGTGAAIISRHTGIPLEMCFAVGDSTNDISMLSCVGHPIVMGSAPRSVQSLAEYVTDLLENDGIAHAMEYFGLI